MSNFKSGDKVKVIGNTCYHKWSNGDIIKLERIWEPGKWVIKGSPNWYINEGDIELLVLTPGVDCLF